MIGWTRQAGLCQSRSILQSTSTGLSERQTLYVPYHINRNELISIRQRGRIPNMDRCKTARRPSQPRLENQYRNWRVSKVEIGDTGIKREIKGKEGRREEFNYSCTTTRNGRTSSVDHVEYQTAFTACQGSSCSESRPCSFPCPRSTDTRTRASGSTDNTSACGQACHTAHTVPFALNAPASHSTFHTHSPRVPTCS